MANMNSVNSVWLVTFLVLFINSLSAVQLGVRSGPHGPKVRSTIDDSSESSSKLIPCTTDVFLLLCPLITFTSFHKIFPAHVNQTEFLDNPNFQNTQKIGTSIRLPLCYLRDGRHVHLRCIYDSQRQMATWEQLVDKQIANCQHLQCSEEDFSHDYIIGQNKLVPHKNKWKRAHVGGYATLQDVCLKRNGLPVTRRCVLKNGRSIWEDISHWPRIKCLNVTRQRTISTQLNTLHEDILQGRRRTNETQGRRQVVSLMSGMLRERRHQLLPADVHLTGEILRTLADESSVDVSVAPEVVSICSALMSSDRSVLRLSANLNATNSLLNTFESYMDELPEHFVPQEGCGNIAVPSTLSGAENNDVEHVDFGHIGVQAQITHNLSVFFLNPSCANITGIAVFREAKSARELHKSSNGFWYCFLYANETIENLQKEAALEVAAYVPSALWSAIEDTFLADSEPAYLVFKLYAHDALFVETAPLLKRKPFGKVLSISIPGYDSPLPGRLPFLLRNHHDTIDIGKNQNGCGYWNYETWLSDGIQTNLTNESHAGNSAPIIVCSTQHLTQFSYLLGGSFRQGDLSSDVLITPAHEQVLDIISLVGCSLSLLGLLGIWITAALFKSWRSLASTKILLNLCVALTLQMVLFVFVNTDDAAEQLVANKDYSRCVILGASLQYAILVLFMWMLIIAILQFQRYVTVIGIDRPRHYILKAAVLAWGLPLLPTLLVAFLDPLSYIPTEYQLNTDTGICYPSGPGLHFGLILPVSIVITANVIIVIYVFYSITHSLGHTMQRMEKHLVIQQIRLSILLFFLLGLSWIFGIFAFMKISVAFSYLFCLTATMQGFVLFIFFVVLDEITRREWLQLLCPKATHERQQKKLQEMHSMTTTSTHVVSLTEPDA